MSSTRNLSRDEYSHLLSYNKNKIGNLAEANINFNLERNSITLGFFSNVHQSPGKRIQHTKVITTFTIVISPKKPIIPFNSPSQTTNIQPRAPYCEDLNSKSRVFPWYPHRAHEPKINSKFRTPIFPKFSSKH
mmetsp:Transcript_29083/g.33252  ORF Transcript_29083/g.33252 Transcript_29083/m.33252 type:complete len:133 (+) Transcript_29083:64-462(+)